MGPRIWLVLLALFCGALSGCVSKAPDPLDPLAILSDLRARTSQSLRTENVPVGSEWFPIAGDVCIEDGLTLDEANALALYYSPAVRVARASAGLSGAQVLQAGVLKNPKVFLGPRISSSDSGLIFPVSANWELPLWGRRDAEKDVAYSTLGERELQVIGVELTALSQVRSSYLRLARLQREGALWAIAEDAQDELIQSVRALQQAGEVGEVSLFVAELNGTDSASIREQVLQAQGAARRELFLTLGLLPDAPVDLVLDGAAVIPELPAKDDGVLLSVPTVRQAKQAYASAEAGLRLEVTKQYPAIRIGPEIESDRGDLTLGLGLGTSLPVFDRNQGGIAAALASRDLARERYGAALVGAAHEEARARADLATAQRLLKIHRDGAMRDAEDVSQAIERRLRSGRADVTDIMSVQRKIVRARTRELELLEQIAVGRFRAAVAGGHALHRPSRDSVSETNP